jgi:hypothetical protein
VGNETASKLLQMGTLDAGPADRERARLALQASSKLKAASILNFFKPRAEAVAAAAGRQAEQRAVRDEQRARRRRQVANASHLSRGVNGWLMLM